MHVTPSVHLPAVPEQKLPEKILVSVNARAARAGFFSTVVDVDVENNSPSPLICDIRGRTMSRTIEMRPGYVWIDPNTTGTLHVRVGSRVPIIHTVIVRLRDNAREYLAETAVQAPALLRILPALLTIAFLTVAAFLAAGFLRPRIDALTAPARVIGGDGVDVAYAARGAGNLRYTVQRDGTTVAEGALAPGTGTMRFITSRAPAQYNVLLTIAGPFGNASAQRTVVAQAAPVTPIVAEIHSLDAQPGVAISGKSILVRYSSNARSGTVRLLDASGTPWDAAPFSAKGATALHAPHVDAPSHFTIRLDVRRAGSIAAASTGVEVLPQASPSTSPSAQPSGATPPPISVGNVSTDPSYVISGTYFTVTLHGSASHVTGQATLQNTSGAPLQSSPVAPGQDAKFIAPSVKRATRFYVMVTATHERSGQIIVVPVVVHPT